MTSIFRNVASILVRFSLSSLFLSSSMHTVFHWQEKEQELFALLSDWQLFAPFPDEWGQLVGLGVAWTPVWLLLISLGEFVGGVLILVGTKEKWAAALLLVLLVGSTLLSHPFWLFEGLEREVQTIHFLKNLAIMSALLLVLLHGIQPEVERSSFDFSTR